MSYAPSKTYFDADGTILGCFRLKENDNLFEYSVNDDDPDLLDFGEFDGIFPDNFPHKVWVTTPWEIGMPESSRLFATSSSVDLIMKRLWRSGQSKIILLMNQGLSALHFGAISS
jgi:hypothetical protein